MALSRAVFAVPFIPGGDQITPVQSGAGCLPRSAGTLVNGLDTGVKELLYLFQVLLKASI